MIIPRKITIIVEEEKEGKKEGITLQFGTPSYIINQSKKIAKLLEKKMNIWYINSKREKLRICINEDAILKWVTATRGKIFLSN